ncbi:hypothetical protein GCM10009760_34950 [Kitasatospora kazusensis]|uniref:Uncharacterized protein n=1 Tax=Kitasatospora kazusensis TaxID=407974 RepID=A0ABP5LE86_9ACTN
MGAELAELATTGATTLVGLMVTDAWTQARDRFGAFLARFGHQGVAEQLDVVREEIAAGGDSAEAVAELAPRLRRALAADPAMATAMAELLALLAEFAPEAAEPGSVHNTINGGTYHAPVLMTGSVGKIGFTSGS